MFEKEQQQKEQEQEQEENAKKGSDNVEEPKVPLVAEATEESYNTTGNEILLLPEAQLDGQESVSLEQVPECGHKNREVESASVSETIEPDKLDTVPVKQSKNMNKKKKKAGKSKGKAA